MKHPPFHPGWPDHAKWTATVGGRRRDIRRLVHHRWSCSTRSLGLFVVALGLAGVACDSSSSDMNAVLLPDDLFEQPAVQLTPAATATRSRIGGEPALAGDVAWPTRRGRPLGFIAQIALEELPEESAATFDLPKTGTLYFFYDCMQMPWGFDPKDAESARVLYSASTAGDARPFPDALPPEARFTPMPVVLQRFESLTDAEWLRLHAIDLEDSVVAGHLDRWYEDVGQPRSQLFGSPLSIQGGMRDQCALVTNGIYLGGDRPMDKRKAARHAKEASDWILLLQVDSHEEETGMMWGDAGRLFYWIRKEDLAKQRFDDVWAILQCY